jgi:hypothetical protein
MVLALRNRKTTCFVACFRFLLLELLYQEETEEEKKRQKENERLGARRGPGWRNLRLERNYREQVEITTMQSTAAACKVYIKRPQQALQ